MFKKDDLVVYDNMGVCRIVDVCVPPSASAAKNGRLYYKLSPVFSAGTIYIPVDTQVFMRHVISRDEADALISRIPDIEESACSTRDPRFLAEHYRASLKSHKCEDLVQLTKTIYSKSRELQKSGKKPGKIDQQYMKLAEKLLYGELSVALEIPIEDVQQYIADQVEPAEDALAAK